MRHLRERLAGMARSVDRPTMAWFWSYYRGRIPRLVLFTAGSLLQSLLVLPVLALVRYAFDTVIPAGDVPALVRVGLAIVGIRTLGSAISLVLRSHILHTVKGAVTEVRRDLVSRVYQLSRLTLVRADLSVVHTQILQDSERVDHFANVLFSVVIPAAAASMVLLGVLVMLDPALVVVASVVLPMLWLAGRASGWLVRRHVFTFQRAWERFSKGLHFVVRQLDLTRVKAYEAEELERQQRHIAELYASGHRMAMSYAVHGQVQRTLTGIGGILILVIGGAAVARGTMTLGEFLTFYLAAGMLYGHLDTVTGSVPELLAGGQSLATLHRFMTDGEPEPYRGTRVIPFSGSVEVRGVSFTYGDEPLLRQVDLVMPAGTHVAIAGANGAGKSTLVHLILGFYRPHGGMLLADGVPYDEIDIRSLRRSIGVVSQRPEFFAGTVRENIVYGSPGATQEEIERAARLALADEVIATLPRGYDTELGEQGVMLSGGEGQRIAIARALLGRPRFLILDEPTNHLDAGAVARLMRGIARQADRPTVLVISHDTAVLDSADSVYRMHDGTLTLESRATADAASA
ncbi:MAG TPA: ABC transporter ATP-binding protein [Gemmatimonadaceae bacterium]|nr:ABC transporter ATP-binding protein [Gemmatimonadaceae bacterium]